jgi:hypothetical protein
MCNCKVVNKYVCMGKCKHNHENKIDLPSGATVPCSSITGTWLHFCINEYHQLNPNQQGATQMLCEVANMATFATLIQAEVEPSKQNKVTCFKSELGQPSMYVYRKQGSSKGKAKEAMPLHIIEIHSEDDSTA